jgi:hypothetical protein
LTSLTLVRPLALPLSTTIVASSAVPTANEIVAAAKLPVDLPNPALMGACSAMHPPTTAMIRTANPRSIAVIFADRSNPVIFPPIPSSST